MLFYWKQTKNIVETTSSDKSTDLGYVGSIGKYFGGMAKNFSSYGYQFKLFVDFLHRLSLEPRLLAYEGRTSKHRSQ